MSIQATDFQRVLNVVGEWYRRSFRDLLVNGQYAIHDIDRQQIPYISMFLGQRILITASQSLGLVSAHGPHSSYENIPKMLNVLLNVLPKNEDGVLYGFLGDIEEDLYSGFRLKFPNGTVSKGDTVAVLVSRKSSSSRKSSTS